MIGWVWLVRLKRNLSTEHAKSSKERATDITLEMTSSQLDLHWQSPLKEDLKSDDYWRENLLIRLTRFHLVGCRLILMSFT